jgi:hypothetical protein
MMEAIVKVEILNICDFASADAAGKLNIIGVFNSIWAKEKPIVYGLCALVIRIRFDKLEEGLKKVKIAFVDADGKPVMPIIETQIQIQFVPWEPTCNVQLVTLLSQLRFPNFGEYSIDVAIDGKQEASSPFYVHQAPAIPPHLQPQLPLP